MMREEDTIYLVTSLDRQSTLEVSHEVFKLVCSLTAELNATKISLKNYIDRVVNPPIMHDEAVVAIRTKHLTDKCNELKKELAAEKVWSNILFERMKERADY